VQDISRDTAQTETAAQMRPVTWTRPPCRAPQSARSCRELQMIRPSSDAANPLSRSQNQQADGDGWVVFACRCRGGVLKGAALLERETRLFLAISIRRQLCTKS
jgi:hypothetical protein